MNLKEKLQNASRSYKQITDDAEKYIIAAIESLDDKKPSIECSKIALVGNDDHFHVIIDDESKLTVIHNEDPIKLILDETKESVVLNEKDSAEVRELLVSRAEKAMESYHAVKAVASLAMLPKALEKLHKEGKDPMSMSVEEILKVAEQLIEEV